MLGKLYARWMYRWETALTTRDENRIVRPVEWGFDWLDDFIESAGLRRQIFGNSDPASLDPHESESALVALNEAIVERSEAFYSYARPADFQLETRHPQLFPTNVRPETLKQDAELKRKAAEGKLKPAQFLRFTSPIRTPVSGKRSGERTLVSRAGRKDAGQTETRDDRDAAVER